MNRREFTASLGALAGAAALPAAAVQAAVLPAATPVVPHAAYSWAHLIARARGTVSPALLARQLSLTPDAAQAVFNALVRDGVVRAAGTAGAAQAVTPLQTTGHTATTTQATRKRLQAAWEHVKESRPLVKEAEPALECGTPPQKDAADACTDQPVQESPV